MFPRLTLAFAGVLAAATVLTACDDDGKEACDTVVNTSSAVSSEAGKLTVSGTFYDYESVLITFTSNGQDRQIVGEGTAPGKVTFSGLPSGSLTFRLNVSCDAGREAYAEQTKTIL